MNDDELPMRAETASAYLDGELDAAERNSAAADRDTMALVDSFAQVRAILADVAPVDDDTRSATIAAALAEFDVRQSAAPIAAAAVAGVTPLQKRRMRSYRLVTGVAAAVLIGVVAVAALNSTGNDSNTSSANEAVVPLGAATAESTQTPALKVADTEAAVAAESAENAATPAAGGSSADSSATTVPAVDNAAELAQYASELGSDVNATDAAPAATEAPAAAEAPATTVAAAATATPQVAPASAAATSYQVPACLPSYDTVLGAISVKGTPALAVRDVSTGMLQAIDASDCQVFFSVAGP